MTDKSLLPYNSTNQERALALAVSRISDVPVPNRTTWDPLTCPENLLPWLAWSFSINEWNSDWPVATKRAVIAAQVAIHRRKGTIASMRQALTSAGYGDADIVEGGSGEGTNWAYYHITLKQPIANSAVDTVRRILRNTAPARCVLESLNYDGVQFTYDGTISYDGTYNFGVAKTA